MRGVGGVMKSIHQSWLAKGLGLGLLCWGFNGVQEVIPSEEAITLQIGSVAFPPGQCTSPQLHPCHRLFDQDELPLPPYRPGLAPCDFWLFHKLRGCCYERIEEMKEAVTKSLTRSHKRTSMRPSRSCWNGKQVHCSRRRLLWRRQEIHVCTIIKVPIRKKSLETYLMTLVIFFLYEYMYSIV